MTTKHFDFQCARNPYVALEVTCLDDGTLVFEVWDYGSRYQCDKETRAFLDKETAVSLAASLLEYVKENSNV